MENKKKKRKKGKKKREKKKKKKRRHRSACMHGRHDEPAKAPSIHHITHYH
jgi:hypothetical protein